MSLLLLSSADLAQDVTCDLGVCSVTGFDATITTAVTVTADLGACSTVGLDASAQTASSQQATGDLGVCATVGLDATITTAVTIVSDLGSCTTVGLDATISTAVTVTADAGACTTVGLEATVTSKWTRQIVIDHNSVAEYDQIPDSYKTLVKCMLFNVPGESHAKGYLNGALVLEGQDATFPCTVSADSSPPPAYVTDALRLHPGRRAGTGWDSAGEEEWFTNATGIATMKAHLDYCEANSLHITAMLFGWCWDMCTPNLPGGDPDPVYGCRWAGASVGGPEGSLRWGLDAADTALTFNSVCLDTYLAATEEYRAYCASQGYATTRIVFTTGPVDSYDGENGYQRHLKHERIRAYVAADETRILFDQADILAWNNDGEQNLLSWSGHDYQHIHADNLLDIGEDNDTWADHIGEVGALRLAKAVWVLMARIAGWDGVPAQLGVCSTVGNDATVTTAVTVTADLGVCATVGLDATAIAEGGSQQVTGDLGVCAAVGLDASITTAVTVTADLGACATVGLDATAVSGGSPQQVTGDLGVCSTVGWDALIDAAITRIADLGAISVVGLDASVTTAVAVEAECGALATVGLDGSVTTPLFVTGDLGVCAVVGLDASFSSFDSDAVLRNNNALLHLLVAMHA